MKIFPLTNNKGGGVKRQGVVSSAFPNPSRQPPEGFAFFPPFSKGDFQESLSCRCAAPPRMKNDLPGSVAILAATMNFSPETCPYRPRVRAGMPALPGIFRGVLSTPQPARSAITCCENSTPLHIMPSQFRWSPDTWLECSRAEVSCKLRQ